MLASEPIWPKFNYNCLQDEYSVHLPGTAVEKSNWFRNLKLSRHLRPAAVGPRSAFDQTCGLFVTLRKEFSELSHQVTQSP